MIATQSRWWCCVWTIIFPYFKIFCNVTQLFFPIKPIIPKIMHIPTITATIAKTTVLLTLIFLSTEGDCGCLFLEHIQQGTLLISYTLGRERCCFFWGWGSFRLAANLSRRYQDFLNTPALLPLLHYQHLLPEWYIWYNRWTNIEAT